MGEQTDLSEFSSGVDIESEEDVSESEPYKNSNWLTRQYWDKGLTQNEIAEEVDVSSQTISYWMDQHGIERRSRSEAKSKGNIRKLEDGDWLREQYWDEGLTQKEIAESVNVSVPTVLNWMDEHSIERRSQAEISSKGELDKLKQKQWLEEQFVQKDRSQRDIASELGLEPNTVAEWITKHGLREEDLIDRTCPTCEEVFRSEHGVKIHHIRKHGEKPQPPIDRERLRNLYHEKMETGPEMADRFGETTDIIYSWLDHYNIERRIKGVSTEGDNEKLRDEDWLRSQYVDQRRTTIEIADELGLDSDTVGVWLGKHGIETVPTSQRWLSSEAIESLRDPDWMYDQYVENGLSSSDIANELDTTPDTVLNWLEKHGIERREPGLTKGSGSIDRYYAIRKFLSEESWDEISMHHRKENSHCQLCLADSDLHVHHIIPVTAGGTNEPWNLMTLCSSCHPTVEWYTAEYVERYL